MKINFDGTIMKFSISLSEKYMSCVKADVILNVEKKSLIECDSAYQKTLGNIDMF